MKYEDINKMGRKLVGKDGKLYVSATAVTAAVTDSNVTSATLVKNISDVDIQLDTDTIDVSTRDDDGWTAEQTVAKKGTIPFTILATDADDATVATISDAYDGGSLIFAAGLTRARETGGSWGLVGNFTVSKFNIGQKLKDAQQYTGELKTAGFNRIWRKSGSGTGV